MVQWQAAVLDPRVPANRLRCSGGPNLVRDGVMVRTATVVVRAGPQSNIVVAHAWSSNGPRIDASARIHYTGVL